MDLRKIEPREEDEKHSKPADKPKRQSRLKPEREPSPLSGLLAVGLIIGIGVLFVFSSLGPQPQVKGVTDKKEEAKRSKDVENASSAIRERVDDRLESVKEQVAGLTQEDIVVDSPQVQKIITDLQALQGLPANQAREACESICQSIQ